MRRVRLENVETKRQIDLALRMKSFELELLCDCGGEFERVGSSQPLTEKTDDGAVLKCRSCDTIIRYRRPKFLRED